MIANNSSRPYEVLISKVQTYEIVNFSTSNKRNSCGCNCYGSTHVPIIQVQIGKNMVDNVLLDEGANVNIITEQLHIKLDLLKPNSTPNHLKMVVLNNVQTTKNHSNFENIHPWDTICHGS